MKSFALTSLVLLILTTGLLAQTDPLGQTDTVAVSSILAGPGKSISVSVTMWNDERLGALTLPFKYPQDKLQFQGVDFAGGRVDYVNNKPVNVDSAQGKILIGIIVVMESYIPTGSGLVCNLNFLVKDNALPGEILTVDTTFYPPIGHLMLSDATGMNNFIPAFVAGKITIGLANRPPVFVPIPDQYVAEGESLYIGVEVVDPDGDDVIIVNPIHPFRSSFTDNGDGTGRFAWQPDYIGPMSSDLSPFYFIFWASDGEASNFTRVRVNVINVNRPPIINAPAYVEAEAGDSLGIHVSSFDPDFEPTEWAIEDLPSGATFDFENPGFINWVTDFGDSGTYHIRLISYDPYGLADTADIEIKLKAVTLYSLRIDTLSSFSGRLVSLDVDLRNRLDVLGYNILIRLDPSVLTILGVSRQDTRSESLPTFTYRINDNGITGNLRVSARGDAGHLLTAGEGPIFRLELQICSDLNFVGQQIPVVFNSMFAADNSLTTPDDQIVYDEEINLFNGYVLIMASGERMLGDINLNSIAYEISDAVYFSNFFISPVQYPLNEQQLINSDINRDGYAPSVADLVMLVTIITGETPPPVAKPIPGGVADARAEIIRDGQGLWLTFDSPVEVGGAYARLVGPDAAGLVPVNLTEMDLMSHPDRDGFNCLLISYFEKTIPPGQQKAIKLSDDADLDVHLDKVDLSDTRGGVLFVEKVAEAVLPSEFELFQNYPNPFNPVTEIRFNLEQPSWVTLTVYNILGQAVAMLADRDYPAGGHAVVWDGTNQSGHPVASGVYLYRLKAGEQTASRKMILVK